MGNWNDRLFLLINAGDHPSAPIVAAANLVAADVIVLVVAPTFMFTAGLGLTITGAARRWGLVVAVAGVLVAWARIYLGLHFPLDMASSAMIAVLFSLVALALEFPVSRIVVPIANRVYDAVLDGLRFPKNLFPRTPE